MKNSIPTQSCFSPGVPPGEGNATITKQTPYERLEPGRQQPRSPFISDRAVRREGARRFRLAQAFACVLLAVSSTARAADSDARKLPPQAHSQDCLGAIFTQIQQSEYDIHWQPTVGAYMAPNRAHNMRFTFHDDGLTITPRQLESNQPPWSATLRLDSYGRATPSDRHIGSASWTVARNTAQDNGDGIRINYKNDSSGLRQDFLIKEMPPGAGPLRLDFDVKRTGLNINVDTSKNTLYLVEAGKLAHVVMRYRDIHVFDAKKMPLGARIEQVDADRFAIVVQDAGAQYPVLVDPTLGSDGSLDNPQDGSLFGQSVAYIKSVEYRDSDGTNLDHHGLIVGAPHFDSGSEPNAGKVFYYDATNTGTLPSSPTWSYAGGGSNELLGWSVADGGPLVFLSPLIGSAQHPIIVGAPGYCHTQTNEGAAFAFYQLTEGVYDSSPDWTAYGVDSDENFGWSVAGNVDFNNDTYGDIIVGGPNFTTNDDSYGKVQIFEGNGSGYNTTPSWSEVGPKGSQFGYAVDWGNVQGSSSMYPALLVGAPGVGRVYEFLGNSTTQLPDTTADATIGSGISAMFGYAIASRQDQNKDGYHDLLVGDPTITSNSMAGAGAVYLYRGSAAGLSTTAAWSLGGDATNANFGTSVALGDMNGDGYADVIVGEPNMSVTSLSEIQNGYVQFYITDVSDYKATNAATVVGLASRAHMGTSVAYGDPFISGHADLIAGVPGGASTNSSPNVVVEHWSP